MQLEKGIDSQPAETGPESAGALIAGIQRLKFDIFRTGATAARLSDQVLREALVASLESLQVAVGAMLDSLGEPAETIAPHASEETEADDVAPRHWAALYDDLAAIEADLLARAEATPADGAARPDQDIALLQSSVAHLRERGDYWREVEWQRAGITRDQASRTIGYRGRQLRLTQREYELLTALMDSPARWQTAPALVGRAWGGKALSAEQLRTYVARLRQRTRDAGIPIEITTERGRGYLLTVTVAETTATAPGALAMEPR